MRDITSLDVNERIVENGSLFLEIECSVDLPFEQTKQRILQGQIDSKKIEKIKHGITVLDVTVDGLRKLTKILTDEVEE